MMPWLTVWVLTALATSPPIQGNWVLRTSVTTRSKAAWVGEVHATTHSTLHVRWLRRSDGTKVQSQILCQSRVTNDTKSGTTIIPDAFIQAYQRQLFPIRVAKQGASWVYSADPGTLHIGYDPQQTGGELPKHRKDPGVIDWDNDGYPGATVLLKVPVIGLVRLYIAQRGHSLFHGTWNGTAFTGRVQVLDLAQHTLGASHAFFNSSPTIQPMPEQSTFVLTPTSAKSCDELLAAQK